MEQIDETNDRNLIAAYLYGFLDLWCLIGRHFLILIVCGFLSLMLCIIQPTLLVGESSKMARIFLGGMLVNIWPLGDAFSQATFDAFLQGNFTLVQLQQFLVATVFVVVWDELPLHPLEWIECVGIPVVVRYGPLAHHCAIYIPKMDPYRPYHAQTEAAELYAVDRVVRRITEVARAIVDRSPCAPMNEERHAFLVRQRGIIFKEVARIGLFAKLQVAKKQLALVQQTRQGAAKLAGFARTNLADPEGAEGRHDARVTSGQNARK